MAQNQQNIKEMMAKLRANFRGQLLDKLLTIEDASVRLAQSPHDSVALARVKRECHKLSGVARSLGFSKIGDVATDIDCAISKETASWSELQPTVERLLDMMEAELD